MRNRYRLIATHSRALPELWHQFQKLARENRLTANAALGRLIAEAVRRWQLPDSKTPKQ